MSTSTKSPTGTKSRWSKIIWISPTAIAALFLVVLLAKWLREVPGGQSFLADFPGHTELPEGAPVGLPAWLGWQHFLNMFFIVLIIRSGWLVRTTARPKVYWTRNHTGLIRTKNQPTKISLDLWLHLTLDALWVINGIVFIMLLVATGQWVRIVPTSWDVVPNAASAALQYASLNWPTEDGWVNYNSLQLLAYFTTVFIAAPLALITGLRMSPLWPTKAQTINRIFPITAARAMHFPVMLYFVLFIIAHVTLVLATGALRNLNHMYASSDEGGWLGFWIFAASLVVVIAAWLLAKPIFLQPIASLTGRFSR
ncbi:thiosulfate reductase cytochrome b subunit [Arthrobacter ginsengisoli]|uniref:Thiosulfate reductase cytochrome b subunit n=1 Tax=Arthrobacter ginsengisoli TaxID=1356565 RepID=A0ABU1UI20_9MICC|nr:cytochrome b/b6 domain-containing protein [Arthrobacter ginsengisoli]MDR7084843.1 thiosulfate reductase cytochrome b subunit [Arthrobacter ginsengisoli]